ncbi:MAG: hypothetical protein ACP5VE_03740 [Chthonomonadales bacterium]
MGDVGMDTIEYLYNSLKIDDEWSVREERGFTWWGYLLAQRIWAEPCIDDDGIVISRIQIRTDFARDVPQSNRALQSLMELAVLPDVSGFVRDPKDPTRVQIASSHIVHSATPVDLQRLIVWSASMQQGKAHRMLRLLDRIGAKPDVTHHPRNGPRLTADEWVNVEPVLHAYGRKIGCPWENGDLEAARIRIFALAPACVLTTGDASGLAAEFPFRDNTILLQMEADRHHPVYYSGIITRIMVPVGAHECPDGDLQRRALELNELHVEGDHLTGLIGSWYGNTSDNYLVFSQYVPSMAYVPNSALNLGLYALIVINWIAAQYGSY